MRIKRAGASRWKKSSTGSAGKLLMAAAAVMTEEVRVSAHQGDFRLRWKPAAMFLAMIDAATRHADALGFGFESMHANEMAWVLSRLRVHFHAFPRMGETVSLQTWPRGVQHVQRDTAFVERQAAHQRLRRQDAALDGVD